MEKEEVVAVAFIIGIILGMGVILLVQNNGTSFLGQAICEEEYGMDYDYYGGGVLHCQQKEVKEQYDGIEVELSTYSDIEIQIDEEE